MRFGQDREPAAGPGDERVVVNDKRRIDPTTGALRDNNPFASAKDPGDPANAAQPISVERDGADDAAAPALEAARQEAAERLADLQRVTAEYANYRKRVDRDREQVIANAKALVLTELLPVLDDVDRADRHGDVTGAFKAVADRLIGTLSRVGLIRFGAEGDPFDPSRHEAVSFTTSAAVTDQSVDTVMRHGYTLGERLIRAAVVGVVGPGENDDDSTSASTEEAHKGGSPGFSGGLGENTPDDGNLDPTDATDSLGPEHTTDSIPESEWASGGITGDSGGSGGVAPDGTRS